MYLNKLVLIYKMSYDWQEAGLAGGTLLLRLKIEHDEFWRKLHKENSYSSQSKSETLPNS